MPSTWPTPRVWTAGERVSASKMNELSTAFTVLYPFTAGGDIAYRDPAGNYLSKVAKPAGFSLLTMGTTGVPAWLATLSGGMPYGISGSMSWLAKPAGLGLMQNTAAGVPSWVTGGSAFQVLRKNAANTAYEFANAAGLHAIGTIDFNPGGQVFASTWADITGATLNLTLTSTCTVVVIAVVVGVQITTGRAFYYRASVDGNVDSAPTQMFNGGQSRNESLANVFIKTGVTAGTKTVKLQCEADSGAQNQVERGRFIAMAFVEN